MPRPLIAVFLLTLLGNPFAAAKTTLAEATSLATTPDVQRADWAGWWPDRHAQKLAERDALVAAGKSPRVIFVGDSITHGWEQAGKTLWEERFAPLGAMNLGFSGDRTEQVLWRLGLGDAGEKNNTLAGLQPELFVLMIGTNNTGHRQDPPEATYAGVKAIVERLLASAPKAKVLLLAVFPRGETADDPLRRLNVAVNERLATLEEIEGVEFVDLSEVFLDDDGKLPKSVMPDLLHPNEEGYRLWADALAPHLDRLLAK